MVAVCTLVSSGWSVNISLGKSEGEFWSCFMAHVQTMALSALSDEGNF